MTTQENSYERKLGRINAIDDPDRLEDIALRGEDETLRRGAFSRLTGWQHYEPCDACSHITYRCDRLGEYSSYRARQLCQEILEPAGGDEVLYRAAEDTLDRLDFGRDFRFSPGLKYVAGRVRAEASFGYRDYPRVEYWFLGLLKLSELYPEEDFDLTGSARSDVAIDIKGVRRLLEGRGVDTRATRVALRKALEGAIMRDEAGEAPDMDEYWSAAEAIAREDRYEDEIRARDLLAAILDRPTGLMTAQLHRD